MAITWENVEGLLKCFVDGILVGKKSSVKVGETIAPNGVLMIGQSQLSLGVPSDMPFVGSLSAFGMWDTNTGDDIIVALATGSGRESGNVVSWRDLRNGLQGETRVIYGPLSRPKGMTDCLLSINGPIASINVTSSFLEITLN